MFVDSLWAFIALFTACVLVMFTLFHLVANVAVPRITKYINSLSTKTGSTFRSALLDQAVLTSGERTEAHNTMIAEFTRLSETVGYKLSSFMDGFSADLFNVLLQDAGYIVTTFTEWCEDKSCKTVAKLVAPNGTTIMVSYSFNSYEFTDHKGREGYKTVDGEYDLKMITDADGKITYGSQLAIIHAAHLDQYDEAVAGILSAHEAAHIVPIIYKESTTTNTKIGRIKFGNNGPQLIWDRQQIKHFTDEQMDAQFAPIELEYAGEQVYCHASDAFNFGTIAMRNGQNLFIYGPPGLGKTTGAEKLLSRLQQFPETYCIWLTVDVIESILSRAGGVQELADCLAWTKHMGDEDGKNVKFCFFIDEAEKLLEGSDNGIHSKTATFMLELLDGAVRKIMHNVTTCLVFNADPTQLNTRLFRKGRGMLLKLDLLDAERATKFMVSLRDTMTDRVFDAKQFDKLLTEAQVQTDGQVYAPIGYTTVADVVNCYRPKEMHDSLLTAIRAANKPKVYEKPKPKVTPEVVIPAPTLKVNPKTPTVAPNVITATTPGPNIPLSPAPVAPIPKSKYKGGKNKNRNRR